MTKQTIRVGLIGYGYAGRIFHVPLITATPGFVVTTIATSRGREVAAACPGVAIVSDPADLIASDAVDLVVVATPNDSHADWACRALRAGKHVVVEKPFALDLEDARKVVDLAAQAGRVLSVFHNRRWDSDFLTVKAAIEAGRIGRVAHFETHFDRFRPKIRDRWRERNGAGGGIWYDLGPHLVDQALQLFGFPTAVEADLATLRQGASVDDWAHAILHYPQHRVVIHASMLVAGGSPRFIVHGDGGSLHKTGADQQEAQLIAGMTPGSPGWGEDTDDLRLWDADGAETRITTLPGDQRRFYQAVGAAIRGEAPNPVPAYEALGVMAVIEAGHRSSTERRTVTLGQPIHCR